MHKVNSRSKTWILHAIDMVLNFESKNLSTLCYRKFVHCVKFLKGFEFSELFMVHICAVFYENLSCIYFQSQSQSFDAKSEKQKSKGLKKGLLIVSFHPSTQQFHHDALNALSDLKTSPVKVSILPEFCTKYSMIEERKCHQQ